MKKLITIILILVCGHTFAADYYFSQASGDDTRTAAQAQNPATPWKSLTKAQTVFTTGNRLYFQRGDTWYGSLTAQGSGTSGTRIFVGAYGTGAKPIITGFTDITAWGSPVSNVYTSTSAASTLSTCNITSIDGANYAKARLPKSGYYTIGGGETNGSTTITNSNITTSVVSANAGAQMVLRELMYVITANDITNVSGNTATFSSASPAVSWGFFLQNDIKMCTQANEWVYNTSTKKISIYSTSTPVNIKVPTIETAINCNNKQYITFDNINLVGFNSTGINTTAQTGITIQNCDFSFIGQDGIYAYGNSGNLVVTNCTFSNINSIGIHGGASSNAIITNNTLNRIGYYAGMGGNEDLDYTGIICHGDNTVCQYNSLTNIGFNGIYFDGNSTNISYNNINTTNFVKDDGGCIYGFPTQCTPPNSPCTQPTRTVSYNTCLNSIGAPEGSIYGSQGAGIYLDGQMANVIVTRNNVGCSNSISTGIYGIFLNGGRYNTIEYNTVYNWKHSFYMQRQPNEGGSFINDTIRNNKFCTPNDNSALSCMNRKFAAEFNFDSTTIPVGYYAANNIYANPLDQTTNYIYGTFSTGACYSLAAWKTATGRDVGSTASPLIVSTLLGDCRYITNPTAGSTTISLGANYVDLENNSYPGTITVAAYSSAILLKSGTGNTPPTCTAIPSATITLPVNSVSLNGVATSTTGGSIVSWAWVKTSGGAATITNASAQNTTVTGLVQGSYVFTLTATDNNGLTCTATKNVTVNAAIVYPTANAGTDQTITLPTNSVTLSGSGTGGSGTITGYSWSLLSGAPCNIQNPSSASTQVDFVSAGIYTFMLTVYTTTGYTAVDQVQVTVIAAPVAPTCNAGTTPVTITLPVNSVGLTATGSGANAVSFLWSKVSGTGGSITSPTSASTTATGLTQGSYVYRITVTDNVSGLTCTSDKSITVNAATPLIPPTVNAGVNQSIQLPTNSVTVTATAVASSGSITGYQWIKVTGGAATITSATSASTTITGLVAGVYLFSVTATQTNGLTATDTVQITVNAANTPVTVPKILQASLWTNPSQVVLGWTADITDNSRYFVLQKKTKNGTYGNRGANIIPKIGTVDYWAYDFNPAIGANTYRIKVVDKSGTTYSEEKTVVKKKSTSIGGNIILE